MKKIDIDYQNYDRAFKDAGTLKYNVNIVDFSEKDGDKKLSELRQSIKEGKDINELELIFLPLMRSKLNKIDIVKEVVNLEIQISKDEAFKQKLVAITLVMSDKLIKREELNKIWEEIRMFKFIEYAEGKGMEKGVEKGILKNQREVILDFLQDMGNIPEDIRTLVQKEVDLEKLKKWVKISAKSQSIEDFRNKLDLH